MADKQKVQAIEKTLDNIDETLETLERIPTVRLNGTTKNQQFMILGTTAGLGVATGIVLTVLIRKGKMKFLQSRNRRTINKFADRKFDVAVND